MPIDKRHDVIKANDGMLNIILSVILTSMTSVSFSCMIITAYKIEIVLLSLIMFSVFMSVVYALLFRLRKTAVTVAVFLVTVFAVVQIIRKDMFETKQCLITLLYYIDRFSYDGININVYLSVYSGETMMKFFNIMNLIPIAFLSYAISRRKLVILPLILYIPYFLCAVSNVSMVPNPVSCEFAVSAFLLLFIMTITAGRNRDGLERGILTLTIPVLIFAFLVGFIFPSKKYDKDQLAYKGIDKIRALVIASRLSSSRFIHQAIDNIETGKFVANYPNAVEGITGADTDLTQVGNFDPAVVRLGTLYYSNNSSYYSTINSTLNVNAFYLRASSKEVYSNNTWSNSGVNMEVYDDDLNVMSSRGRFNVQVHLYNYSDVTLTPYYTDFYTDDIRRNVSVNSLPVILPYESVAWTDADNEFTSCNVPLRVGDIFSDEYMEEYVYGTNLQVPEGTRQAIIDSGILPEWYMEVLNGERELSLADKVRGVTSFVESLHPYDRFTDYPPEGSDFVVWFMTESDSGFCVHYASASVILLRMIGVPARYCEGYLLSGCTPNRTTSILTTNAHSWFEVFIPEFGWVIGDPTPGNRTASNFYNINALTRMYPEFTADANAFAEPTIEILSDEPDAEVEVEPGEPSQSVTETTVRQTEESLNIGYAGATDPSEGSAEGTEFTGETAAGEGGISIDFSVVLPGLLVIPAVILLIMAVRFAYIFFWEFRFGITGVNRKIRAYYRYFRFRSRFLGVRLPAQAEVIADKTAFSNDRSKVSELETLIYVCVRSNRMLARKLPWYKRILFRFLSCDPRI